MRKVKIFDQEYPVLARYSAIKRFCDRKGMEYFEFAEYLASLGKEAQEQGIKNRFINDLVLLMYFFVERGLEAEGENMTLKEDDIFDWILLPGNLKIVSDLVMEAQGTIAGEKKSPVKSRK